MQSYFLLFAIFLSDVNPFCNEVLLLASTGIRIEIRYEIKQLSWVFKNFSKIIWKSFISSCLATWGILSHFLEMSNQNLFLVSFIGMSQNRFQSTYPKFFLFIFSSEFHLVSFDLFSKISLRSQSLIPSEIFLEHFSYIFFRILILY